MSNANQLALQSALTNDYEFLTRRLARRLGSSDLAREVLHDAYLKLDRVAENEPIGRPSDYIFRIAVNVAKDRWRNGNRVLNAAEIDAVFDIPDGAPSPSDIVESKLEMREFQAALGELSERRQRVFAAAHLENMPHSSIAERLGVHVRTIDFDLQYAMEHLSRRLGRKVVRKYGPRAKAVTG